MKHSRLYAALGVTAVCAISACSVGTVGPGTAALDTQINNSLASFAGQGVASDLGTLTTGGGVGGSFAVFGAPLSATRGVKIRSTVSCTRSGGVGDLRYYCSADTVAFGGGADTVITTQSYEFFSAGTADTTFVASTDSINFGGAAGAPIYIALHGSQSNAVSHRIQKLGVTDKTPNFTTDTLRTWNGSTTAADTGSYSGAVFSLSFTGTATDALVNVVTIHPASTHPYPASGQYQRAAMWNYAYTGPLSGNGTASRAVTVTFNGTQTVPLQVTGGSSTLTCSLDLATGAVSGCQ